MRGRIRVDRMIDRNDRIAEGRGALSEIKNGINATLPEGLWLLTDRGLPAMLRNARPAGL